MLKLCLTHTWGWQILLQKQSLKTGHRDKHVLYIVQILVKSKSVLPMKTFDSHHGYIHSSIIQYSSTQSILSPSVEKLQHWMITILVHSTLTGIHRDNTLRQGHKKRRFKRDTKLKTNTRWSASVEARATSRPFRRCKEKQLFRHNDEEEAHWAFTGDSYSLCLCVIKVDINMSLWRMLHTLGS